MSGLRHFNEDERRFVLLKLAEGHSLKACVEAFMWVFPDFGRYVEITALQKKLRERVRNIKRNHPDAIQEIASLAIPDRTPWRIDTLRDRMKIVDSLFQRIYNRYINVPVKSFVAGRKDSTGVVREVYKYNASLYIEIFKEIQKLTKTFPGAAIAKQIPITNPAYRLKVIERLVVQIPIKTFCRYSRKKKEDTYTYHVKLHLKLLTHAGTEMKSLPIAAQFPFPRSEMACQKILQLLNMPFEDFEDFEE